MNLIQSDVMKEYENAKKIFKKDIPIDLFLEYKRTDDIDLLINWVSTSITNPSKKLKITPFVYQQNLPPKPPLKKSGKIKVTPLQLSGLPGSYSDSLLNLFPLAPPPLHQPYQPSYGPALSPTTLPPPPVVPVIVPSNSGSGSGSGSESGSGKASGSVSQPIPLKEGCLIVNGSNFCFFNSIMQLLYRVPFFRNLKEPIYDMNEETKELQKLVYNTLKNIFSQMSANQLNIALDFRPQYVDIFKALNTQFGNQFVITFQGKTKNIEINENDATEALVRLIDFLYDKDPRQYPFRFASFDTITCSNGFKQTINKGIVRDVLDDKGNKQKTQVEFYNTFPLGLSNSIQDSINNEFKIERSVDNIGRDGVSPSLDFCKTNDPSSGGKNYTILKNFDLSYNKSLLIVLIRMGINHRGGDEGVFDTKKCIANGSLDINGKRYNLKGCVRHTQVPFKHYTYLEFPGDGSVIPNYEMDDSTLKQPRRVDIDTNGYLFHYELEE